MEEFNMKLYSNSSNNISRTIRNRYVLALSIIVFLLILSQIIIQYNIHNESYDSRIVNISGRQRMLSQKISKDAYGIFISSDEITRDRYLKELRESTDLWKKSHLDLKNGNLDEGLPGNNSEKIMQLFSEIEDVHQTMLDAAYKIIHMIQIGNYNEKELKNEINIIEDYEPLFLKGMDSIVFQYDSEAKEKIDFIKKIELLLLNLTFMTIILEVLFIFIPAEKNISKAFGQLEESQENLQKLFETAPAAMLLISEEDLSVILKNKYAQEMIGESAVNTDSLRLDKIFDCDLNSYSNLINKIKFNERIENYESILKVEGKNKIILISSIKIQFNNKTSIILFLADITKQKKAEEILRRLANYDELTGLLNRQAGWLMLENAYEKSKSGSIDFSICFIDIDGLKYVNDEYGHDEGDCYIKTVAHVLTSSVHNNDCIFRYGGDEIVIVFNECDMFQAKEIMKRAETKLKETQHTQNKPYSLRISYGIVNFNDYVADTIEDYIRHADHLMYENKKSKKGAR
jgi:diguanylate cyclase (GGDEF)-like protein/PAS domain S-box-containing protein